MMKAASVKLLLVLFFLVSMVPVSLGQRFHVVANFNAANGSQPEATLVQGRDGNFYGTTYYGGVNNGCDVSFETGCGTVFKVTPQGKVTVLYSFCAQPGCIDGYEPVGALTLGTDGAFYGTTYSGIDQTFGTIFKISAEGRLKTLHNFCSSNGCADGSQAIGQLVEGPNGDFYGTTTGGGIFNSACPDGCGTVFKVTPGGTLTTLYSFTGGTDGGSPLGGLVLATDGSFYGTTFQGGAIDNPQCAPQGCGTVFRITPAGLLTTVASFIGYNGLDPEGALVQAVSGNLYGTTNYGGQGAGTAGAVFKVSPAGTLKAIYAFCSLYNCADGSNPTAGLTQGTDGNFYGTTSGSNVWGSIPGTVFQVTPAGKLTTLYTFCSQSNCNDGYAPYAGMLQATDGNFYGTADGGGTSTQCIGGCGTLFRISMGLDPFIAFVRSMGKIGSTAQILGQGLEGTSAVSFNGIPARFTVDSATLLTATVPEGTRSGYVTVTTPGGTLKSNVPFQVQP
jgi:uncharacterized repeat protein (TIGR03803 family)